MLAIISTGGTILSKAKNKLASYDYSPKDESLEELLKHIDTPFRLIKLCNIDSSNMNMDILNSLAKKLIKLEKEGIERAVVLHGTDTMQESAFFINLVKKNIAVVFTGSMRPASAIGYDGLKNLLNAIILVKSLKKSDAVMIAMNDEFFTANSAIKTNSVKLNAFSSINYPKAGEIKANKIYKFFDFTKSKLSFDIQEKYPKVGLIYAHLDLGPQILEAYEDLSFKALVIAAFGSGTISDDLYNKIKEIKKLKIILSTRVLKGGVILSKKYKNIISAGFLSPEKARILASLALANDMDIKQAFLKI